MTPDFLLGLVLIAACPALMRLRYGRDWLLRPFGLLVLMGVIYHGASEVVNRVTGADALVGYRAPIQFVDRGMVIAGTSLLAMTVAYCLVRPSKPVDTDGDLDDLRAAFNWRLTGLLALPLFAATVAGQGYATGQALEGEALATEGFAQQFFVVLVVLTSFGLLLKHPSRFLLIVLIQTAALGIAGQRLEVFVAAALLWLLAARVGIGPNRRQVLASAAVAALVAVGIGSVRGSVGRDVFQSDSGLTARAGALWEGITSPEQSESVNGGSIAQEGSLRLDSNAWAGQVVWAFERGRDPLGTRPLVGSVLTAVPSILYPDKVTDLSLLDRSPELAQIVGLGLSSTDFLPGHAVTFLGALGPWGNVLFSFLVGAALALLETFVLRPTPGALVGTLLLAQAALFFERGLSYYLLMGRAFIVLAILVWIIRLVTKAITPASRPSRTRASRV